eukprot:TRINITY_DN2702_c0_g1_i18.p1 TRINITY_DN2702_c0_g1~~TRINITY_DN2702_c0_g1_i18.p1  ORF type:complete len:414 (-),score=83.30 TRINITY_DN2702_c0_g1_i18:99-1340(-)
MIVFERMVCDVDRVIHAPTSVPAELHKYLEADKSLSLSRKLKIAHDAILGISWLHDILSIVHRDLKPANLMLDENFRVKVTDFGFSQVFRADRVDTGPVKGTKLYMAPEIWTGGRATKAADIYAFGYVLWEMYTEMDLFGEYCEIKPFYDDVIVRGKRPAIPEMVPHTDKKPVPTPPSLVTLMQECWHPVQSKRPTSTQVLLSLENIMIETHIASPLLRSAWKSNFGGVEGSGGLMESVSWETFTTALEKMTRIPKVHFEYAQAMFCGATPGVVTMERVDLIQKWFGDFTTPAHTYILQEMVNACNQEWFMPDVSKEQADKWLHERANGTFLVRPSSTDPSSFPFTVSYRRDKETQHRRVQRLTFENVAERYRLETSQNAVTAATLCDLLALRVKSKALTKVCPREPLTDGYL